MAELNIYQKLDDIKEMVDVIKKNKKAFNYSYVPDAEILARIKGKMKEHHLSLIPQIVPGTGRITPYRYDKTKTNKAGEVIPNTTVWVSEVIVTADMLMVWVNNDNPEERVEVPWLVTGQQADASQAFGSGLTYCYRYFLLKYFGAATTDDDPDHWRSKQMAVEAEAEQRAKAEANKELETKRKEITELGSQAIGKNKITGPALRKLIEGLNPAGGSPGDIEDVETAEAVIKAIKALKPKKEKKDAESTED